MPGKLDGKVALTTGGGTGIGLATATEFAQEGAQVYITGRRNPELDAAAVSIGRASPPSRGTSPSPRTSTGSTGQIRQEQGRAGIVFANAAIAGRVPFGSVTQEHAGRVFGTSLMGLLFTRLNCRVSCSLWLLRMDILSARRVFRGPGIGWLRSSFGVPSGLRDAGTRSGPGMSWGSAGDCVAGSFYTDRHGREQGLVAVGRYGRWGKAAAVPVLAALNADGGAGIDSVSCASAGNCAAGGDYAGRHGDGRGFVVSQT